MPRVRRYFPLDLREQAKPGPSSSGIPPSSAVSRRTLIPAARPEPRPRTSAAIGGPGRGEQRQTGSFGTRVLERVVQAAALGSYRLLRRRAAASARPGRRCARSHTEGTSAVTPEWTARGLPRNRSARGCVRGPVTSVRSATLTPGLGVCGHLTHGCGAGGVGRTVHRPFFSLSGPGPVAPGVTGMSSAGQRPTTRGAPGELGRSVRDQVLGAEPGQVVECGGDADDGRPTQLGIGEPVAGRDLVQGIVRAPADRACARRTARQAVSVASRSSNSAAVTARGTIQPSPPGCASITRNSRWPRGRTGGKVDRRPVSRFSAIGEFANDASRTAPR